MHAASSEQTKVLPLHSKRVYFYLKKYLDTTTSFVSCRLMKSQWSMPVREDKEKREMDREEDVQWVVEAPSMRTTRVREEEEERVVILK